MNKKFKLNLKRFRLPLLIVGLVAFTLVGTIIAKLIERTDQQVSAETVYISQDISKADFIAQQDFPLQAEQDDDTPFKILDARASVISSDQYQELTSQRTAFRELVSVPRVTLQNVSDKTITGVTLIISDKATNIKRGFYIKKQSIKPGQMFTILPENLVRSEKNPARNTNFWLDAVDKSQVAVRVVAFFEDGSMWANKNQRY